MQMGERFSYPLGGSGAPGGALCELLGLGSFQFKELVPKKRVLLFCCLALAACAKGPAELICLLLTPSGYRSGDEHRTFLCCFQPKPKMHLRGVIRTGTTHCNAGSVTLPIKYNTS